MSLPVQIQVPTVTHRFIEVDGVQVFFREAGPPGAPTLLLLHGFPSGSHQFRRLIDALGRDFRLVDQPGREQLQIDLTFDCRRNVELYSEWQAWLRARRPPALILWGRNDPFFVEAGAHAYLRDLPDAELHLLDAGHFALEDRLGEMATLIAAFVGRISDRSRGTAAEEAA